MEPAALRLITLACHADRRGFVAKTDTRKNYIELGMDFELCRTIIPFLGMAEPSAACIFRLPQMRKVNLLDIVGVQSLILLWIFGICSPTYGQCEGYKLNAENGNQLYIPVGFAYGFVALEPDTEFVCKCSDYYAKEPEGSILWNSLDVRIDQSFEGEPILSNKYKRVLLMKDFDSLFVSEGNP